MQQNQLTENQHQVLNLVADEIEKNPNPKNPFLQEVIKIKQQKQAVSELRKEESIFEIMGDIQRLADEIINY